MAVNRYTALNLTKLDVLDAFPTIKVAIAYKCKQADGSTREWRDRLPADCKQLEPERCEVEYVDLAGWNSDISKCRKWADLPRRAQEYVSYIEKEVEVPVEYIGVGAGREAMITKPGS